MFGVWGGRGGRDFIFHPGIRPVSPLHLPTSRLHFAVVSSLGRRYPSQSYACLAGSSAQIRRESEEEHILAAGWAIRHLWFSADSTMADAACHLMKIAEEELVGIIMREVR